MTRDSAAIESFYGRWATLYDVVATVPGIRSWRERAVETLDLSPGETVVEMGCGTGANFPHIRQRVGETGRVVGVDLVPGMLGRARRRIDRAGWRNVHVVRGDASRPPTGDADAILCTFLVGMLDDPEDAVRTWCDSLSPGGCLTLLNAGQSDRPLATPLNAVFRVLVRLATPGKHRQDRSAARTLDAKWHSASAALHAETTDSREERFGLGFLRLAGGRVQ